MYSRCLLRTCCKFGEILSNVNCGRKIIEIIKLHIYSVFVITMIIPIIGCICLHYGVGGKIKELAIGIVNHEVTSYKECFNQTSITVNIQGFECLLNKASCRFIEEIDSEIANKVG